MSQPYYVVSHSTGGRPRHRSEQPADGCLFARDPDKWLAIKRQRHAKKAKATEARWQREKRRTARARGLTVIGAVLICLQLTGCPMLAQALMYGASAATLAKDVLDIDVSLRQDKPDKTPIGALVPAVLAAPQK